MELTLISAEGGEFHGNASRLQITPQSSEIKVLLEAPATVLSQTKTLFTALVEEDTEARLVPLSLSFNIML